MSTHKLVENNRGNEGRGSFPVGKPGESHEGGIIRRAINAIRRGVGNTCRAITLGVPLAVAGLGLIAPNSASANAPIWRGAECSPVSGIGEGLTKPGSVKVYTGPDGNKYSLISITQGSNVDIFRSDFSDADRTWNPPTKDLSLSTPSWDFDVAVNGNKVYLGFQRKPASVSWRMKFVPHLPDVVFC
jgi:hypothetical protein